MSPDVPSGLDSTARAFRDLAAWCEGSSPLYEQVCRGIAADEALLALADEVPDDRSTANVTLAAVHYLLLRGSDHALADYYPSVTDDPREPDDDLVPAFRDFCLAHAEDLRPVLRERRTQTNAVRRCAVLYPAFARVARATDGPLALVELGPSAGLNLLWDRYRYEYSVEGADATVTVGDAASSVTISSTIRGDGADAVGLPETPPAVASRVGIDLHPMDVTDPEDADWLRALVWPEHDARRRVLADALAVAREDPPPIREGDAIEVLPEVLAEIPEDRPVVVFDTLVLYQLPDEARERLREVIHDHARTRSLHWLSGQEPLDDVIDGDENGLGVHWTRAVDGAIARTLVAGFEQHGRWIRWFDR